MSNLKQVVGEVVDSIVEFLKCADEIETDERMGNTLHFEDLGELKANAKLILICIYKTALEKKWLHLAEKIEATGIDLHG